MTNNQIRESEETVLQIIHANDLVFAKESPLSLAKEIQGLRAVFDEVPHTHTTHIARMLVERCGALHFPPRRAPHHHMLK